VITYLQRLTSERDSLTQAATQLAEKAATEDRDLTDTEQTSLKEWEERCAEIDKQLVEYNSQAESQRAYARLREQLSKPQEPSRPAPVPAGPRGWGDLFINSEEFRSYPGSGTSRRVEIPWQTRAEITTGDLPLGGQTYVFQPVQRVESTPLLDAIGDVVVGGNSVEWVKWTPAAAPSAPVVPEGTAKPEMALDGTPQSDTLDTYAHWKGITRQALEDVPQIRSIVEGRLRSGLTQALNGAAVTALNGGTYTGVSDADLLTGIRLGLATAQEQGYGNANVAVVNPADLAQIDISVMGSTSGGPTLNSQAWGLTFIPVSGVTAGTAFVGDVAAGMQLFRRSSAAVYMSDSHADFFIKNIILILAEIRALAVVSEPGAIVEVTVTP
jgi:HK97 family phage major capsid protein